MTRGHGTLMTRLVRGTSWSWRAERHVSALPGDLDSTVMALESTDRPPRQARAVDRPGPVRFGRRLDHGLPQAALSPALGSAEWPRCSTPAGGTRRPRPSGRTWSGPRSLGIAVPEVVAVGEWVGPWGALQSYLMVAELVGHAPLHEAIPELARSLDPRANSPRSSGPWSIEMAEVAAKLHAAHAFHKDLYLCHFFLDLRGGSLRGLRQLCLIDLHRLAVHRWTSPVGAGRTWGNSSSRPSGSTGSTTATGSASGSTTGGARGCPSPAPAPLHQGQGGALPGPQPMMMTTTVAKTVGPRSSRDVHAARVELPADRSGEGRGRDLRGRPLPSPGARRARGRPLRRDVEARRPARPQRPAHPRRNLGTGRAGRRTWSFARNSERAFREAEDPTSTIAPIGLINTWHHDVIIPQGGVQSASLDRQLEAVPPGWRRPAYILGKQANPKAWIYRAIEHRQYDPARKARVVAVSEDGPGRPGTASRRPPGSDPRHPQRHRRRPLAVADPRPSAA